jgi:hypothetical protein
MPIVTEPTLTPCPVKLSRVGSGSGPIDVTLGTARA